MRSSTTGSNGLTFGCSSRGRLDEGISSSLRLGKAVLKQMSHANYIVRLEKSGFFVQSHRGGGNWRNIGEEVKCETYIKSESSVQNLTAGINRRCTTRPRDSLTRVVVKVAPSISISSQVKRPSAKCCADYAAAVDCSTAQRHLRLAVTESAHRDRHPLLDPNCKV